MSPIFGGKKKKKSPPRVQRSQKTQVSSIIEIRRRFLKMKQKAMIYAVIGAIVAAILGLLPLFVVQLKDSVAIGMSLAAALFLGYLSVAEITNAFSYYLFARIKEELKGKQLPSQQVVVPTPQPAPMQVQPKPIQPMPVQTSVIPSAPPVKKIEQKQPHQPVSVPTKPVVQRIQSVSPPMVSAQPPVKPQQPIKAPQITTSQPSIPSTSGKKKCPYCGRELPYGDLHVICPFCGRRLK